MKKLFLFNFPVLIITFLFFAGCEKNYDNVVQPEAYDYQVVNLDSIPPIVYYPGISTLLKIRFESNENISRVSLNLFSPAGDQVNSSPEEMTYINNNTYSYLLKMQSTDLSGTWIIKYYVTDPSDKSSEVAVQKFRYNNGTANTAPFILNVDIDPDTLVVTDTVLIRVTAAVSDSQGLADISSVYFVTYRPDGTTSGNQNILSDDGIKTNQKWDETAGDGIYSQIISVNQNAAKGLWRFDFTAKDRNNLLSDIVSHYVLIQ